MYKKKIGIGICSLAIVALAMVGCSQEYTTYSDDSYIIFADSMTVLPVQNDEEVFDIVIAATKAEKFDRNVGVEILPNKSNAIEGRHYAITSQTVTIPAGSMTGTLKVRGIAKNIDVTDSIGVTLRLVNKVTDKWEAYGDKGQEARVMFRKACPFNLEQFTGHCTVRSSYFQDYMPRTTMRLVSSVIDPVNKNTIILKDFFYKGFDIRLRLDTANILRPDVYMDKSQQLGTTAEAFGTIYGNGQLMAYLPSVYTSYFSSCEEFITIYPQFYVDGVGTVGTFTTVIKFITDEEYEVYKKLGY